MPSMSSGVQDRGWRWVEFGARVRSDEARVFKQTLEGVYDHETVDHSAKEYVRGEVHTNTVEGYFSLLKRGVIGTFHQVSKKHLPLYLAEFDHRYNHRKTTDGERTVAALRLAEAGAASSAERARRRRRVEVTHDILADLPGPDELGFLHSGLCQVYLPRSRPPRCRAT